MRKTKASMDQRISQLEQALTWVVNRHGAMTTGLVAKAVLGKDSMGRAEKWMLLRAIENEEYQYLSKPWIRSMVNVEELEREDKVALPPLRKGC